MPVAALGVHANLVIVRFPFLTLLFQSLIGVLLGIELCLKHPEDPIVFDTQGIPFAYVPSWLLGKSIISYIHYPFLRYFSLNSEPVGGNTLLRLED